MFVDAPPRVAGLRCYGLRARPSRLELETVSAKREDEIKGLLRAARILAKRRECCAAPLFCSSPGCSERLGDYYALKHEVARIRGFGRK